MAVCMSVMQYSLYNVFWGVWAGPTISLGDPQGRVQDQPCVSLYVQFL